MPAIMEEVNKMTTAEKLRLMECILKSITTADAATQDATATSAGTATSANMREGGYRRFTGPKPNIADFIGYGARFHKLRSTEEWLKELREGEE